MSAVDMSPDHRREVMLARLRPAINHFLGSGVRFSELTVERIISVAGIARSTFYAYFTDKGDLLGHLAAHAVDQMVDSIVRWSALPPTATKSELAEVFAEMMDRYREHSSVLAAMSETAIYDRVVAEEFRRMMRRATEQLERHVSQGQAAGSVRADLDPVRTVLWLGGLIERGFYLAVYQAPDSEVAAQVTTLTDIVWHILYEGAPTRTHRARLTAN